MVKLSDDFNGADLRNVCTEAGMFAIRADRDFVIEEDFMKAVRKVWTLFLDAVSHLCKMPSVCQLQDKTPHQCWEQTDYLGYLLITRTGLQFELGSTCSC